MRRLIVQWLAFLVACVFPLAALGHKPSDSYLTIRAAAEGGKESSTLSLRWDIALRDLDYVLQLDRDGNGELTWGEVRQRSDDITRLAVSRLSLMSADAPCPLVRSGPVMLDKHSDGTYAVLSLSAQCPSGNGALQAPLKARYSMLFDVDPSHRGLVQWAASGEGTAQALVFGTESAEQVLALKPTGVWQTLRQYLKDGVLHIWAGYDHILFLLALLLPAVLVRVDSPQGRQWQPAPTLRGAFIEVVKVVTAFTLAHSITLSLASLHIISLPSRLVESLIAASVIFAALNNLRSTVEGRRWIMAFVFGLVHGFGFASVLADLGLPQGALVLALVGFNAGVEVGQLTIVAVFLPLAFWLRGTRFYRVGVLIGGSLVVALLASWWLVQRMFDL